jgi:hypothetical protein
MDFELSGNYPIIIDGKEIGSIDVSRDGLFWSFEATSEMESGIIRLSVFGDGGEGYLGVMEPRENRLRLKKKFSRSAMTGFPASITHAGRRGERHSASRTGREDEPEPSKERAEPSKEAAESAAPRAPLQMTSGVAVLTREAAEPGAGEHLRLTVEPPIIVHRPNPAVSKVPTIRNAQLRRPPAGETEPPPEQEQAPEPQQLDSSPVVLVWSLCGCPAAYISNITGKNLFGSQKNVMESSDGEHVYLAIPADAAALTPGERKLFSSEAVIMGEKHLICKTKNGMVL